MSIKQQILSVLEENKGQNVSGAKLASNLNISRNAIWKAIKNLQKEGYSITAVTNKGYCLAEDNDILSSESITPYLSEALKNIHIEVRKSVTSTNTVLKEMAAEGEAEGKVLIAEEQTGGRGRLGRTFYSPVKTGIYMSLLLRPRLKVEDSLFITTAAAVSAAEAIEEIAGCQVQIKWVNDLYIKDKKVCGILTEAGVDIEGGGLEYCVLGIGINVARPENDFPEELKEVAQAVFEERTYSSNARSRLVAGIINKFWGYYEDIQNRTFLKEYRKRSLLIGKEIEVLSGQESKNAVAVEIDDHARLLVRYTDGSTETLSSGEVSIRVNA